MKPILFFAAALAVAFAATAQNVSSDHYQELKSRHIGPVGNRIASVAGVPDDPLMY